MSDLHSFYEAVLSAGAILTGFSGSFLQFRIQREANYYRQPALDYQTGVARDVFIGLTHFTLAFFLIIIATLMSMTFRFIFPLLGLADMAPSFVNRLSITVGLLSTLCPLSGYFLTELIHYRILSSHLVEDFSSLRREWPGLVIGLGGAALCWIVAFR